MMTPGGPAIGSSHFDARCMRMMDGFPPGTTRHTHTRLGHEYLANALYLLLLLTANITHRELAGYACI